MSVYCLASESMLLCSKTRCLNVRIHRPVDEAHISDSEEENSEGDAAGSGNIGYVGFAQTNTMSLKY